MQRHTRYLLAFGGLVGGGLLVWTGHAIGSHGDPTLRTCVSQGGTIRAAQSCQARESSVVLVREEALTHIELRLGALEIKAAQVDALANRASDLEGRLGAAETENAALRSRASDLEARLGAAETENAALRSRASDLEGRLGAAETENAALRSRASDLEAKASDLEAKAGALGSKLAGVTRSGDTLIFSGMNVQVVNGLGSTNYTNALGNLIVGYNEQPFGGSPRTGSHNLVVGRGHTYSSYGGFVAGYNNSIVAPHASVSGGFVNSASGEGSSVSGGSVNSASGEGSSVSGGFANRASAKGSSVSGGSFNSASGDFSSVSGGSVNNARGSESSVSGGLQGSVDGDYNWRAGELFQHD